MNHASGCLGGIMLVMGGVNTEARSTLDDFNLFDFQTETWLQIKTVKYDTRKEFRPQCLYENNFTRKKDPQLINERQNHQMCAVWDQNYYKQYLGKKRDRCMWLHKRKDIEYEEGFYIFGGKDERSVYQNDLWVATPDYEYNRFSILAQDYELTPNSKIGLTVKRISNYSGQPPCPRSQF